MPRHEAITQTTPQWAQLERREVRRRDRLGGLVEHLPQGFSVESLHGHPAAPCLLRVWGYGIVVNFDPTHGTLWYMGHTWQDVMVWQLIEFIQWEAYRLVLVGIWSLMVGGRP